MPEWNLLLVFVFAVVAISLTPGPDMLFVVANAVGRGARAGVLSAVGISTAMLVHTTGAALGLSYLFARSAWAFEVVRYAGAAYLVWLGVRAIMKSGFDAEGSGQAELPAREILRRGFLTNLLNPKVIVFFAAFLPQFVEARNGPVFIQFLFLGALFTVLGLLIDSTIAIATGGTRSLFVRSPAASRLLERISGTVFVGLGIRLLFVRPSS